MWWIIDVILLAIIILPAIINCIKGLLHSIYRVVTLVVSFLLARLLTKPIGGLISEKLLNPKLSGVMYEKITEYTGGADTLAEFFNNIPDSFVNFVKIFGMDIATLKEQYGNAENTEEVLRNMANTIATPLANAISSIIAFVALFLVVFIVLTVIFLILKKVEIPFLTSIDRVLGLIFGFVSGFFIAACLSTAVYAFLEYYAVMNENPAAMDLFNNSYVFKFIYNLRIFDFIRQLI